MIGNLSLIHAMAGVLVFVALREGAHAGILGVLIGLGVGLTVASASILGVIAYRDSVLRLLTILAPHVRGPLLAPRSESAENRGTTIFALFLIKWLTLAACAVWYGACFECSLRVTSFLLQYWHLT
jgi:hypothetical protein